MYTLTRQTNTDNLIEWSNLQKIDLDLGRFELFLYFHTKKWEFQLLERTYILVQGNRIAVSF